MNDIPFFFRQACRIAERIHYGALTFNLPNGHRLFFEGKEETDAKAVIIIHDFAFARRVIFGGDIGFYESYEDGQWDTPDLAAVLYLFARNADHVQDAFIASPLIDLINRVRHSLNKNTKAGSKRNIMAHYDLGNTFYGKWLDASMTYSSARFQDKGADLKTAQENKYRALAQSISLKPDDSVLEIGSGWGGFAIHAAREYGATVTGLTLSPSQLEYAQKRAFEAGLAERVSFRLQDYRDVDEKFDKIASIEMFEAVGKQYWPAYFDKVHSALKPGGEAGLQIITIADRFFENYMRSPDFIQRYVFPGGALPSPSALKDLTDKAGLTVRHVSEFGEDYARTLNEWRQRFIGAWDEIRALGFDDRFKRLWKFYLAYCEAGFRAGTTNVRQVALSRAR
ncbi:MAG: cyclopropane-fatty-acyl-phospholipid synthase family protein [Pseudomonadota bacterium]